MSLYKQFTMDKTLEKNGILLEYGEDEKTKKPIRIRIARAGGSNQRFGKLLDAKFKPYRRALQTETLDTGLAEKLMKEVYAEAVVLGWENVSDKSGKALPFSPENVIKLFDELPELWSDIKEQAGRAALYRQELQEASAKN